MRNGKDELGRVLQWFDQETMSSQEREKGGRDMGERFTSILVKTWRLLGLGSSEEGRHRD